MNCEHKDKLELRKDGYIICSNCELTLSEIADEWVKEYMKKQNESKN